MAQLYVNDGPKPVNVRYTFPLPSEAAVYACEMWIGDRKIVAKVKPEAEARKEYEEHQREGQHAVLVESVRKNLFVMDLGNLQPGEEAEIKISYLDLLEQTAEAATRVSRLRIPLCPGIPYIPGKPLFRSSRGLGSETDTDQVPDASKITPPRISRHDDRAAALCMEILAPTSATLSSPTHPLHIGSKAGTGGEPDRNSATLDSEKNLPDRDFVLELRQPGTDEITLFRKDNYALLSIAAPVQSIRSAQLAQDIYFLVDRSGSMSGEKWTKTLEALKRFVAILGDQDHVDICFFESDFFHFSSQLEPRDNILRDPKFRSLEKHLSTSMNSAP